MSELRCSFCGKVRSEVARLIAGPTVYICNECVVLCMEILEEDWLHVSRVDIVTRQIETVLRTGRHRCIRQE